MADNTNEEPRLSNWSTLLRGKTCVTFFVVAWICIVVLSILLALMKVSAKSCNSEEKDDCSQSTIALVGKICGGVFILFFVVSGAAVIACNKRHRPESNSVDVVVSEISLHAGQRGFWTEDIDNSYDENDPPPCYEQALRMYGLISIESDLEDQHQQGNNEDTRL